VAHFKITRHHEYCVQGKCWLTHKRVPESRHDSFQCGVPLDQRKLINKDGNFGVELVELLHQELHKPLLFSGMSDEDLETLSCGWLL
jgi:hypothetical protein